MKQYTFVNITKILYGISITNSIDIMLTIKQYLESNNNTVSFEILDSMFKDNWDNHQKKIFVYDQHYVVSPCEIAQIYSTKFKIVITSGGALTINKTGKHKINNQEIDQAKKNISGYGSITYPKIRLPIMQMLKNSQNFVNNKKICFCFLVYDKLNKPNIWEYFFKNADTNKYSILVHSKNELVEDEYTLLHNNLIDAHYETEWGKWSIVNVQNRLLEIGLQNEDNEKFIFVSDSHVPLHDFETVYNCVMCNNFSFIDVMGRLTQNTTHSMNDVFNIGKLNMFKMSQWSCLNREHASMILENEDKMKEMSENSIIPDENAYICTLTGLYFPQKINNLYNKNLTFIDWVLPSTNKLYRAHPRTYDRSELSKLIPTLRNEYLFVRKIAPTCDIDKNIIQPYLTTVQSVFHSNKINMKEKFIVSVYCKKTKNFSNDYRNFWGFGDMIRGTISLYKMSKDLGTKFALNFYEHPISKYFEKSYNMKKIDDAINRSRGNVYTFYKYFELLDYTRKSLNISDIVVVHNNAVYRDRNDMLENENMTFLTHDDKIILQSFFKPTKIIKDITDKIIANLPENYNIIHFRLGDYYLDKDLDDLHFKDIEAVFEKNYEENDILLTDNENFKRRIEKKYKCITLNTNIVHVGISENQDGIKDTLVEWFVQINSKKIKTYSVYNWISGFVFWTHQIYNIPLINMKD